MPVSSERSNRPKQTGRVRFVIELESDREEPPQWWRAVCSIPGREGVLSRAWGGGPAGMDSATYDDLVAWVIDTMDTATVLATGIQGRLMT